MIEADYIEQTARRHDARSRTIDLLVRTEDGAQLRLPDARPAGRLRSRAAGRGPRHASGCTVTRGIAQRRWSASRSRASCSRRCSAASCPTTGRRARSPSSGIAAALVAGAAGGLAGALAGPARCRDPRRRWLGALLLVALQPQLDLVTALSVLAVLARRAARRAAERRPRRRACPSAPVSPRPPPTRMTSWKRSKSASSVSRPCLPYSCATARTRWRIEIGPSSSAAWKAAASEQLRIAPPESLNFSRQEVEVDVVGARRLARAARLSQMRWRSSGSGNGKSITKSSRRTNASSMLRRKFVARITAPG